MLNKLPDNAREKLNAVKGRLHSGMASSVAADADFMAATAPTRDEALLDSIGRLSPNPRQRLYRLLELISQLTEQMGLLLKATTVAPEKHPPPKLYAQVFTGGGDCFHSPFFCRIVYLSFLVFSSQFSLGVSVRNILQQTRGEVGTLKRGAAK